MPNYEILDLLEMSDPALISSRSKKTSHRELVSLDQDSVIEFFDLSMKKFHESTLPDDSVFFSGAKHFFRYFECNMTEVKFDISKNRFLQTILQLVFRISPYRRKVSILDLGTTVGENYHLLRSCPILRDMEIEIEYVGLELDTRLVAFAQDVFRGDQNFKALHGEVSDLGRFPDRSFDLVTSHHVHSYAMDQPAAIREAIRVSRVAAVIYMAMIEKGPGVEFSHATTSTYTGTVFKAPSIGEFIKLLAETDARFVYLLSRNWKTMMKINNAYMGQVRSIPFWHNLVVSRYPVMNAV